MDGLSKLEMGMARKAGHMLTGQHDARAVGAATSSTMADVEAMFSRILEKSQAAHATSSELQQLREVQRGAYPDYSEYDRHSAFYVDCKLTVIVIGGVRSLMAFLDTGCDYSGVHRPVVDRMKPGEVDDVMGVGEDPVGEDGMDIDAPAWPPAGVEPAMRA
eukprot:jgi/Tetstr1/423590/TSEL_014262.t1